MEDIVTVILAAGKGTRMKSEMVKVLHPLLGLPMLSYSIDLSLNGIKAKKTIVVVGYQADRIQEMFKGVPIEFVIQKEQLGTGHAVLQTIPSLQEFDGSVLILCGDVPLVTVETLRSFIDMYRENESTLSVLTAVVENPFGYGRVLRTPAGWLEKIVEEKDATDEERLIREINTGIYCVKAPFLKEGLRDIGKENAQGEYYLTDLVGIAREKDLRCSAHKVTDPMEVMGINTRVDLAMANERLRQQELSKLMLSGVTVIDPLNTYVEKIVQVGRDTIIYPFCVLQGKTKIGERCIIEPHSKVSDSIIGNEVTIHANSVITESTIDERTSIGPFAHLRPLNKVKAKAKVGKFMEVERFSSGRGTRVRGRGKKIEPRRKRSRGKKDL
ncbi:MAG: bifunctional UDP-N-acetylglucosamine diphosphorylase/glucosamine-1-phosphate N-acetyltransferase GlmU [Syntrophaceae bacterium]|nr:bifunctional UDP-N-acetylglucosamine diphosphorylase/glucosamine-1-phosphate N-acetyltransferase GlmU [Syntrophaceae bacterium]